MSSCELVTLISTLSCLIADNSTDDELSILSAVFTQLGDSLATILTCRSNDTPIQNNH